MIDRGRLAAVAELADPGFLGIDRQEIIALGTNEIIDSDRDRGARGRLRVNYRS